MKDRPLSWIVALGQVAAPPLLAQDEAPGVEPKGHLAVYLADGDTDGVGELCRSDLKTGAVVRQSAPFVNGGDVLNTGTRVEPKGRHAVYPADQDTDEVRELYRSLLTNGANPKLNDELVPGGDVSLN